MKLLTALFLFSFISLASAADVNYKFTLIDIPVEYQGQKGSLLPIDVNNKGEMIGVFSIASYYVSANRKQVVLLDCGGATYASSINNRSEIVGSCSTDHSSGFVYNHRSGSYTFLDFPGADGTVAHGINDAGDIVGQYWGFLFGEGSRRFHGFIWRDGVFTSVDAPDPEAMATSLYGVNKKGEAVGTYFHHVPPDPNGYDKEIAFTVDNGAFSLLDFPGAEIPGCCGWETFPTDLNNDGQIVGLSYDSAGQLIWFLVDDDRYFQITGLPENSVLGVWPLGINDKAELVGTYFEKVPHTPLFPGDPDFRFTAHSFVATPAPIKAGRRHSAMTENQG